MKSCAICGSHAFNMAMEGVNQGAFCDRHYWQRKAEALEAALTTPALPQVPEGMAIVPADTINKALHGLEHLKDDIQARSKMQEDYQEGVVMVGAGAWHGLCSAILMLAAAKEKGE